MGNMGAFITIKGEDLTPQYTTFEAVVSSWEWEGEWVEKSEENNQTHLLPLGPSKCPTNGFC